MAAKVEELNNQLRISGVKQYVIDRVLRKLGAKHTKGDGIGVSTSARIDLNVAVTFFLHKLLDNAMMLASKDKRSTITDSDLAHALELTDYARLYPNVTTAGLVPLKEQIIGLIQHTVIGQRFANESAKKQAALEAGQLSEEEEEEEEVEEAEDNEEEEEEEDDSEDSDEAERKELQKQKKNGSSGEDKKKKKKNKKKKSKKVKKSSKKVASEESSSSEVSSDVEEPEPEPEPEPEQPKSKKGRKSKNVEESESPEPNPVPEEEEEEEAPKRRGGRKRKAEPEPAEEEEEEEVKPIRAKRQRTK